MTYEQALRLVIQGKYAEADEVIIDALEKQIPQKPLDVITTDGEYITTLCPKCSNDITVDDRFHQIAHCVCGQKIDWGDKYV